MKRYIVPLIIGLGGIAVLMSLCIWQVNRLSEKEGILKEIEAKISAAPIPWTDAIQSGDVEFTSVTAEGTFTTDEIHVLTSQRGLGPGYRVITAFDTADGPRILVDRGFIPQDQKAAERPAMDVVITGNLRTPEETDGFTPEPDLAKNIWFARDLPAMAATLDTRSILIILRETSEPTPPVAPWPVDTAGIPNDHLEYAITWFLLALVWAGMTAFLLWRIRQRTA